MYSFAKGKKCKKLDSYYEKGFKFFFRIIFVEYSGTTNCGSGTFNYVLIGKNWMQSTAYD